MVKRINRSWFIQAMAKAGTDLWLKGWHERNGGKVSLRLTRDDVAAYLEHMPAPRVVKLSEAIPEIDGQYSLRRVQGNSSATSRSIRKTAWASCT
jgi:ribulose-5-phosphate 4-epimerase/fuculose-1-phosphate aldolase